MADYFTDEQVAEDAATALAAASAAAPEAPQDRISRHEDIVREAVNSYDEWVKDDDYDAQGALERIIARMRSRLLPAAPEAQESSNYISIHPTDANHRGQIASARRISSKSLREPSEEAINRALVIWHDNDESVLEDTSLNSRSNREDMRNALRAAYAVDFPVAAACEHGEEIIEAFYHEMVCKNLAHQTLEARKERDREKRRADNHWGTLRSIREIARKGDCGRIILWVNDAGSGYVENSENTLSGLMYKINEIKEFCDRWDGSSRGAEIILQEIKDEIDDK